MPVVKPAALQASIASGTIGPLYLLLGKDDSEKALVADALVETIETDLRPFNVDRLFGGELKLDSLLSAAGTLPMMAPRRVVIVLEAEKFLVPKRERKAAERDQERLEAFLADPPRHATVVFVADAPDQRRRVVKRLVSEALVVHCGAIEDDADAERWVRARAQKEGIPLHANAARALVERAGADVVRLRAGLERVALYAMGQSEITAADVREAVQGSSDAPGDFGIANAIRRGDTKEALRELDLALDAGAPHLWLLGQLRVAAERVPGQRVADAVGAVLRTDVALKSTATSPRILLERLTVELCGPGPEARIRRSRA